MCCVLLLAGGIGPRIALFFWWIFGDKPDAAISSWVWGLLGFLFLPWTTLAWAVAYAPIQGVTGFGWFIVILGFLVDLSTISGSLQARRARRAAV